MSINTLDIYISAVIDFLTNLGNFRPSTYTFNIKAGSQSRLPRTSQFLKSVTVPTSSRGRKQSFSPLFGNESFERCQEKEQRKTTLCIKHSSDSPASPTVAAMEYSRFSTPLLMSRSWFAFRLPCRFLPSQRTRSPPPPLYVKTPAPNDHPITSPICTLMR